MLISKKWLQRYFNDALPDDDELRRLITFHAYEVENVEKKSDNTIYDIKVLPDRAHYALSHEGIAYDLAAIIQKKKKIPDLEEVDFKYDGEPNILVEDGACRRYMAQVVENIRVEKSSGLIKDSLLSIGEKSINNVVDLANYVMFDVGQPIHAFDLDKINGEIRVRKSKSGEEILTLDDKKIALDSETLVIADSAGPIAIAGIKGGKRTEVDEKTRRILLEVANFEPSNIRGTSKRLSIITAASKRFENNLPQSFADTALKRFDALLKSTMKGCSISKTIDIYQKPLLPVDITVNPSKISSVLGLEVSKEAIKDYLRRLEIDVRVEGENFRLTIPKFRLDLKIDQDIAEEVARLMGYQAIKANFPEMTQGISINKQFYYVEKIKDVLNDFGFSEILTSSFSNDDYREIENPLASDKRFLRSTLKIKMKDSLRKNLLNADLLGLQEIKIFEIGKIFNKDGESLSLAVGVRGRLLNNTKHDEIELSKIEDELSKFIGEVKWDKSNINEGIMEVQIDSIFDKVSEPPRWDIKEPNSQNVKFKKISVYPFIARDIAIFVPAGVTSAELSELIERNGGKLLRRVTLFDTFEKDSKDGSKMTSYAHRLIFQSDQRTLTDDEVNVVMDKISEAAKKRQWQVR